MITKKISNVIYRDIEHSIDILSMFVYPSLAHEIYNLPNEMKCVYWECVRNHFRLNDGRQAKCFIITCTSPSIFPLLATRLLEHWALHYWINLHHHTNVERERDRESRGGGGSEKCRQYCDHDVGNRFFKSISSSSFFYFIQVNCTQLRNMEWFLFLLCKCRCNNAK